MISNLERAKGPLKALCVASKERSRDRPELHYKRAFLSHFLPSFFGQSNFERFAPGPRHLKQLKLLETKLSARFPRPFWKKETLTYTRLPVQIRQVSERANGYAILTSHCTESRARTDRRDCSKWDTKADVLGLGKGSKMTRFSMMSAVK